MKATLVAMMVLVFLMGVSGSARADGSELFDKKCAVCHGPDGKANTATGRKLNMRDLSDPKVHAGATDAQWEKIILEGVKGAGGKNVMPATKATPEEVKELVKTVRKLKK
jgi:mono/diheme cytochrome c family protein